MTIISTHFAKCELDPTKTIGNTVAKFGSMIGSVVLVFLMEIATSPASTDRLEI